MTWLLISDVCAGLCACIGIVTHDWQNIAVGLGLLLVNRLTAIEKAARSFKC